MIFRSTLTFYSWQIYTSIFWIYHCAPCMMKNDMLMRFMLYFLANGLNVYDAFFLLSVSVPSIFISLLTGFLLVSRLCKFTHRFNIRELVVWKSSSGSGSMLALIYYQVNKLCYTIFSLLFSRNCCCFMNCYRENNKVFYSREWKKISMND